MTAFGTEQAPSRAAQPVGLLTRSGAAKPLRCALVVGLLLAGVTFLVGPSVAGAQEPPPGRTPFRLVGQTAWVAEDQPFTMTLQTNQGMPAEGSIELVLYGALDLARRHRPG